MGVRRVLALIIGLPPGSAIHRALDPKGVGVGWTTQEELMAVLIEVMDYGNRLFYSANSKKGAKQPKPLYVPRPNRSRKRRKASSQDMKAIFAQKGIPTRKGGE